MDGAISREINNMITPRLIINYWGKEGKHKNIGSSANYGRVFSSLQTKRMKYRCSFIKGKHFYDSENSYIEGKRYYRFGSTIGVLKG